MKFTRMVPQETEIAYVKVSVPVRYDDEDITYDAPLRSGNTWEATVEVDTGIIKDWPIGRSLFLSMKVCDEGQYSLLDADFQKIADHQHYYVPHCTVPGSDGDYIKLEIDASGKILNWKPDGTFSGFQPVSED
jgi:hypothetical protein